MRKSSRSKDRASSNRRKATTKTASEAPAARGVFVAVGLGANLGNAARAVREAARSLATILTEPRFSRLYRTTPVGGLPQRHFVNAVCTGRTRLSPRELLARLKTLEKAAGRRPGPRNGPRTLDLDLLLYGDLRLDSPSLTVPHPRMTSRLFVLVPLAEVAPRRVVPGAGKTVARLLREARGFSRERVFPVSAVAYRRTGQRASRT
jgi:2-amino-4-hydroxy-6-hydroxymethyldihydropteridine diphosphokinase